jgi:hypothetical protein
MKSGHPYRSTDLKKQPGPAPTRLVYSHVDRAAKQAMGGMAIVRVLSLPLFVGALAYELWSELAGLVTLVVSVFGMYMWWRRRTGGEVFYLDVDQGKLTVTSASVNETLGLLKLLAVELETKTIQRVQEGDSMIVGMRFIDSKVGAAVDTCRIVLRTESKTVRMGEKYIAHMDAVEQVGKIRVFLRKHGWLPEDERKEQD